MEQLLESLKLFEIHKSPPYEETLLRLVELLKQRNNVEAIHLQEHDATMEGALSSFCQRLQASSEISKNRMIAELHYVVGSAYNLSSGYSKDAESHFLEAVKLCNIFVLPWVGLSDVYWKKGDYDAAKKCLEDATNVCGADKLLLRRLSIILRAKEYNGLSREESVALSVIKAKEAILLDASDPESWYIYGNAWWTSVLISSNRSYKNIKKCLTIYNKAEELFQHLSRNQPDLYTNRGIVYTTLEFYDLALKDLMKSRKLEPGGYGEKVFIELSHLLSLVSAKINTKFSLRSKQLSGITFDLRKFAKKLRTTNKIPSGYKLMELSQLKIGENINSVIPVTVCAVFPTLSTGSFQMLLGCIDGEGNCFVLSLYSISSAALTPNIYLLKSIFLIKSPNLTDSIIQNPETSQMLRYYDVKVFDPQNVLFNGTSLVQYSVVVTAQNKCV